MELYKKYRPKDFFEIIGNTSLVATLRGFVSEGNMPQAIMFTGPSGCGKTTLARIIAKHVDCDRTDSSAFMELNCANFRGIDTAREIMSSMCIKPWQGKSKVYIIDEAHKLTAEAQNALLKPLEDTPENVYFILCTTEPNKLLKTIKTRCTKLAVKALTDAELVLLINSVVEYDGIVLDADVESMIVKQSEGSARSALVQLEMVKGLDPDDGLEMLKAYRDELLSSIDLCRAIIGRSSWKEIQKILLNLKEGGHDPEAIRRSILGYLSGVLTKGTGTKLPVASIVMGYFESSFFESGFPGLVNACYLAYLEK